MRMVYKYKVIVADGRQAITIPKDAKILCVAWHGDYISMWADVDTSKPKEKRFFCVYGTGHIIPETIPAVYIGTAFEGRGSFVWHVFEHCSNLK